MKIQYHMIERNYHIMKVLVVGGGGREHAIIKKLSESSKVEKIWCTPGNGGISRYAECFDVAATDIDGVVALAKQLAVDMVVVAPDDPLVLGAVDALEEIGVPCFGPNKAAAIIESSKAFSKDLMKKYGIPTAAYEIFDDMDKAIAYLQDKDMPIVIKADGLALGKGVIIAQTREEVLLKIYRLKNRNERLVLKAYYIDFKKWERISLDMNFSYRQVIRIHARALKHIEELLNCESV
mgnify:CR=1 FL=1